MSDLHPILDATKRIRLVYDPDGEARQARQWESIGVWLLVVTVAIVLIGIVHLTLFLQ